MPNILEQVAALAELQKQATPGPWHAGCFANEKSPCNCKWITSSCYAGSLCTVDVDNGLRISEGGNDSPPETEAKANLSFIAAAGSLDFAALHAALAGAASTLGGGAAAEELPVQQAEYDPCFVEELVEDAADKLRTTDPSLAFAIEAMRDMWRQSLGSPAPAAALVGGEAGEAGWISLANGKPEVPKEQTRRVWVCIEGEVSELYFGNEVWMDENWDDEDPYTGWFLEGDEDGQPVYRGPAPTHFKYQEAPPAAPTQTGKEAQ